MECFIPSPMPEGMAEVRERVGDGWMDRVFPLVPGGSGTRLRDQIVLLKT